MRSFILLLTFLFAAAANHCQTTDSTAQQKAQKGKLHPEPDPLHRRSKILLEKEQTSRERTIHSARRPPLTAGPRTSAIVGQWMGSMFIGGGIIMFPVMHNQIKKARERREKYGPGGGVLSDIGRGIGVLMANAAVGGGTTMLILSKKKLNKLRAVGVSINPHPTGAGLVYNF